MSAVNLESDMAGIVNIYAEIQQPIACHSVLWYVNLLHFIMCLDQ